jgi:exopolysaccharide biosynthesis operon protein EpsL
MLRTRNIASVGCALVLSAYTEAAPEDPIRFNAGVGIVRDSNLLRLPNAAVAEQQTGQSETSDTVRRLEAGINVDVKPGRQRISGKLGAVDNQYQRFKSLDHLGYDAAAQWDWRAGNRWSGEAGYSNSRTLDSFSDLHQPKRDLLTRERTLASAGYQFHPNWTVRAGAERNDLEHSQTEQRVFDRTEKSADLTLSYASKASNTVGVQVKTIDGRLPRRDSAIGTQVSNNYRQNELNAVVDWRYSALTRLQGKVGYARRGYDEFASRDFSGVAGRLTATWTPREKTEFAASLWRTLDPVEDFTASQVLSKGVSVQATWNATQKISAQARYSYERREHQGGAVFAPPDAPLRNDKVGTAAVSLSYRVLRNTQLGLALQTEKRNSNQEVNEYRANTVLATVGVEF